MSTSGVPDHTMHPAPPRGSPQPASVRGAHGTMLPYVGAAVALVLAVKLADLVNHSGDTRMRADDAPTRVVAGKHRQAPTASGKGSGADSKGQGEAGITAAPSPSREPMSRTVRWEWTVRRRASAAVQAGAALILIAIALAPPVLELAERNVRVHHLEHAALLGGGGILGLVLGMIVRPRGHHMPWERFPLRRPLALGVVLLGPLVVMAAMVPSTSAWIDTHPLAHALEHLALIVLGGLIGLSARLLSTALGWLVVALVAAMAAAFGAMALAHPLDLVVVVVGAWVRSCARVGAPGFP